MVLGLFTIYALTGKNVFYLPDDTEIVQGTRRALQKLEILK